jgi:uncharacterized membrane protein YccC
LKLPSLPRLQALSLAEMQFSAKSFAGAMLALFVAQWIGLPRPFWALLTAYVVSQPLAGTVRSKALYRFCGTLMGSIATVLIVPILSNAPELLAAALALWVAACLYVSLLDRTPRAYVFMLAGYTAALIGFPAVETPLLIFDTAVARVEEIVLGISCATLVHSIVLPTGLTPSLIALLDRTLADGRRWMSDLLRTDGKSFEHDVDRRRLATDITQLRLLSSHVPFDTSHLAWTADALRSMQDSMAALTPTFAAVEDRLLALREAEGTIAPDVAALLAELSAWLDTGVGDASTLKQSLRDFAGGSELATWARALRAALAARLEQLVDGWQACLQLRSDIDVGLTGSAMPTRGLTGSNAQPLHRDRGMAALSAFAAFVAIGAACAFWMLTAWPMGSAAAMMAAVFCSFFASQDDPVPMIHGFLKFTLWSMPIAAVYVLVLLPLVTDMTSLALVCAPVFLLLGCFVARPSTAAASMAMVFGVAGALAAHDTGSADFVSFINGMIGQVIGIVIAAQTTRLVRSVGADWMARRIQRATQRELSDLASGRSSAAGDHGFSTRMLDRIGMIAVRVADADSNATREALRDLRLGADIVTLQQVSGALSLGTAHKIRVLLAGLADALRGRKPIEEMLAKLDIGLAATLKEGGDGTQPRLAVAALIGLRRNLFNNAALPAFAAGSGPASQEISQP